LTAGGRYLKYRPPSLKSVRSNACGPDRAWFGAERPRQAGVDATVHGTGHRGMANRPRKAGTAGSTSSLLPPARELSVDTRTYMSIPTCASAACRLRAAGTRLFLSCSSPPVNTSWTTAVPVTRVAGKYSHTLACEPLKRLGGPAAIPARD
jgi:hypothetical protein